MVLTSVLLVICREEREKQNLTREDFLKLLKFPPDEILKAVEEAIVSFFPTGRHTHVREVLTSYADMASKTDELITAKTKAFLADPRPMKALGERTDQEMEKVLKALSDQEWEALKSLIDSPPGT